MKLTFDQLKDIVADVLSADADSITEETNFKDDLDADSLDLFELVTKLEEDFGVEIPSDDLQNIHTVKDVLDYVNK
ncbi:MAG: acyl carrier protein [Lachnospiraceae bacterium]|nr:acyl carrier protein [Lachnospiraceae bacterium]